MIRCIKNYSPLFTRCVKIRTVMIHSGCWSAELQILPEGFDSLPCLTLFRLNVPNRADSFCILLNSVGQYQNVIVYGQERNISYNNTDIIAKHLLDKYWLNLWDWFCQFPKTATWSKYLKLIRIKFTLCNIWLSSRIIVSFWLAEVSRSQVCQKYGKGRSVSFPSQGTKLYLQVIRPPLSIHLK